MYQLNDRCGLWSTGCGVWGVGCGLWVVGCGLWIVGCGLRVIGCGFWGWEFKVQGRELRVHPANVPREHFFGALHDCLTR